MCASTPRQELLLPVHETAAGAARTWLQVVRCAEHGASVLDDAVLLISELVTNAVRYGGPPIVLAADCEVDGLYVRVRDGSSVLPVPQPASLEAEGGRGFLLLDLLSERWGVDPRTGQSGGKEVWFLLESSADPA